MSETKHSPAPWRFEIDEKRGEVFGYVVTAADGKEIGYWDADDRPETEANARLIGSATDMAATIATQAAQIEALRSAHEGNIELLEMLIPDLRGRVDASKMSALNNLLLASKTAIAAVGEKK